MAGRASGGAGTRVEPLEAGPETTRLRHADRRDALLDAAVELVAEGDLDAVSMEAVAERSGVSRPLVYKHFANRDELIVALYRREAAHLHEELEAEVAAAPTIELMFRTLIRGVLRAAAERGPVFGALRAAGGRSRELRLERRQRDVATVRAFARRAVRELAADRAQATSTVGILLAAVDSVLVQWRHRPSTEHARFLEETYMTLVSAALDRLAGGAR